MNEAMVAAERKQGITPAALQTVREFWFSHLESEDQLILPGRDHLKRWFLRDDAFDQACVSQFGPLLEYIKKDFSDSSSILAAVNPQSPEDWLSLILLLDQIPRNCYRGADSPVVFKVFDPLAKGVALAALEKGIPTHYPSVRYRVGWRKWFYLPLMHSESLETHKMAEKCFTDMLEDVKELGNGDMKTKTDDPDELKCILELRKRREEAAELCAHILSFEVRHKKIIEQFGRYPHRNEALGRETTQEEKEYLENGGETF